MNSGGKYFAGIFEHPPPSPPDLEQRARRLLAGRPGFAPQPTDFLGGLFGSPGRRVAVADDGARRVIASTNINGNRCYVPGMVNGVPLTLLIDTGAADVISLPVSYVEKLGLKPEAYRELWPGTRYGEIANVTVAEIRIGDALWVNERGRVYRNWRFSFGDEPPLLGLLGLRKQGVNIEIDGDTCRLTVEMRKP